MSILQDRPWKLKYTPDHGDLVKLLYQPALECAARYDRLTGYFSASALALAARGIEGLVVNGGRMRMVVGCTLNPPEIAAIEKGEELRAQVAQHFAAMPLMPTDTGMGAALELLAWMVARGLLDVRVGIPCDDHRRPIPATRWISCAARSVGTKAFVSRASQAAEVRLLQMTEHGGRSPATR